MPCSYTKYEIADKVRKFELALIFGSLFTTVRKEVYLHPFISFVSDMAGSFGLFVGFTFFTLWDVLN